MPQVAKTLEQCQLDNKIQKAKSLLKHLEAQQRSLRLRNKADRERERRQDKLSKLDKNIDEDYLGLLGHNVNADSVPSLIRSKVASRCDGSASASSSSINPKSTPSVVSNDTTSHAHSNVDSLTDAKRRKVE